MQYWLLPHQLCVGHVGIVELVLRHVRWRLAIALALCDIGDVRRLVQRVFAVTERVAVVQHWLLSARLSTLNVDLVGLVYGLVRNRHAHAHALRRGLGVVRRCYVLDRSERGRCVRHWRVLPG